VKQPKQARHHENYWFGKDLQQKTAIIGIG
jgi:hypothetical protein